MRTLTLLLFALFLTTSLFGDCVINSDGTGIGFSIANSTDRNSRIGQTFTSCEDGYIESMQFTLSGFTGLGADVELYIAEQSTASNITESPVQTFTIPANVGNHTIILDTPFPVSNGIQYAFQLSSLDEIIVVGRSGDPYVGGELSSNGAFQSGLDLIFEINITGQPIPTMSQWALFILGLCLTSLAVVTISIRIPVKV